MSRKHERELPGKHVNLDNNNNTGGFTRRNWTRRIQLSSVRTVEGPILQSGFALRPYGDRMVKRNGKSNIRLTKFGCYELLARYSSDIFTTVVDLSWLKTILVTLLVYLFIWVGFAVIYYAFALIEKEHLAAKQNTTNTDVQPCVAGVHNFLTALLFSLESAKTIGYGSRVINTSCPHAIACLTIQWIVSAIFDTWVIGMCFMRMARPDARQKTTLFADNAVICTRDGKRCLLVRFANLRHSLLLAVTIKAKLLTLREPSHNEEVDGHQAMMEEHEIEFQNAATTLLTAPVEYCHVINEESPLYDIPENCYTNLSHWFEIVVIITGTIESTSLAMHKQMSYLNTEIKYNHRFVPIILREKKEYKVNFTRFHHTVPEPSSVQNRRNRFDNIYEEGEEVEDASTSTSKQSGQINSAFR